MAIDTTKKVKKITVDGTEMELAGGTSKLPQLIEDIANIELTAEDLAGVTKIRQYAFYKQECLISITIPNSVTSIGTYSFAYCNSLGSINIPGSVTSITNNAFSYCTGLESVTLGDGVTDIGNHVFSGCTSLGSINIPDSVTSIGSSAFRQCPLTSVTIPSNVTSIGNQAFQNCTSLTTMTILATTPPTLGNISVISTATTTIYIPAGTLSAYQSATNWSSHASKFVELSE